MASWDVIEVGRDYFKVGVYNLEKAFSSSNYNAIVLTGTDYGTDCVSVGDIKYFLPPYSDSAKSFETSLSANPDTTYTLYCYAWVNDSADADPYYKIGGRITFTTMSGSSALSAPNEPELVYRFQQFDDYPDAYIKLSGMTESDAAYYVQSKAKYGSGEVSEFSITRDSSVKTEKLSEISNANEFCTTYMLRLGAVNETTGESAWSGWTELTTPPSRRAASDTLSFSRKGSVITIKAKAYPIEYDFTYLFVKISSDVSEDIIIKIAKSDIEAEGSNLKTELKTSGYYTAYTTCAYLKDGTLIYAVTSDGNTYASANSIDYRRPELFEWKVKPESGAAASSTPYSDWNLLLRNANLVIKHFKGRDDITIPYNTELYGDMCGRDINILGSYEADIYGNPLNPPRGIAIRKDKTVYAWRYNALNYIICCLNNTDSETDVTNSNYADKFTSGKPLYARYLTALSDKLNAIT